MSWLINIFFLCQIWTLYLQQVFNNTPMNKDPQPNFKLCPATLGCRNLIPVHFWTYISKKKNFKICFRWRRIWYGWCFGVQSYLKGLWHASAHVRHLDLWSGEPFFQDSLLVKKSSFIDPETPEKAILSVFERYFGSFKRHILYFCASIVEKIRSHWGEVHEGILFVVSVPGPTNGLNVAFDVVIWLSFLSIRFSSQRSTFLG